MLGYHPRIDISVAVIFYGPRNSSLEDKSIINTWMTLKHLRMHLLNNPPKQNTGVMRPISHMPQDERKQSRAHHFKAKIPRAEIPRLSTGSLLQTLSQQGAIPSNRLMAGLIPQTARVSLSCRHVPGKPDVLVCVPGTAPGRCSQTLPWPNCTDVGGAAPAQGCAFLSSWEQMQGGLIHVRP